MKPFVVVSDGFDKNLFGKLLENQNLSVHPESKLSQTQLTGLLAKIEGLVIRSATTVTADFIQHAPNLKYVIRAGEGTDNIDIKECQKNGIAVSNTPGANNNSAAEHAIALMMTALRKTAAANSTMHEGRWEKALYVGNELSNKKIGVVGFGRIGQIVAKRLSGFEPEILFFDPFLEKSTIPYAKKAQDLEEIFKTCDIITLHTPLMAQTKGMVNKALLELMKEDAILINASRGGIVDEDALYHILQANKIKAAAFDVFATEPLPSDSPLRKLENIILTPHIGASTEEAQVRVGEMVLHQLDQFFVHNNLLNEVKA